MLTTVLQQQKNKMLLWITLSSKTIAGIFPKPQPYIKKNHKHKHSPKSSQMWQPLPSYSHWGCRCKQKPLNGNLYFSLCLKFIRKRRVTLLHLKAKWTTGSWSHGWLFGHHQACVQLQPASKYDSFTWATWLYSLNPGPHPWPQTADEFLWPGYPSITVANPPVGPNTCNTARVLSFYFHLSNHSSY